MNKGIYIAALEARSGKSMVSLGLMQNLIGKTPKVGYFRPIINDQPNGKKDNHIETVLSYFDLAQPYETAFCFTQSEVIKERNRGNWDYVIETIIAQYKKLEKDYDFVLVEGTDFSAEGNVLEFDLNVFVAKNLSIPVLLVSSGYKKDILDWVNTFQLAYQTYASEDVQVLAVIANKVEKENIPKVRQEIQKTLPNTVEVFVIPLIDSLQQPSMGELKQLLNAQLLYGENFLNNKLSSFAVGAMQLRNFLSHLKENCLVTTPGDRADIILASLQANASKNYPKIAGIVLTGGLLPEPTILELIEGMEISVPILSVPFGTFQVANEIGNIQSNINPNNKENILLSISTFQQNVPVNELLEKVGKFSTDVVTPQMFQYRLIQKAEKQIKKIVLPEGIDPRILTATSRLSSMNLVDIVLLGEVAKIKQKATELALEIDWEKVEIINPIDSPKFEDYVETFYQLRKHKNVNHDIARDWMTDVSYFGTMMIYKGDADGMVSGAMHTTQHTIRPALQFIKTKPGVSVVSSIFFMCLDDRVSVFGDCAINPNPNAEQLAEIAISSADSSAAFGIEPRIAMLSYSSGTSGKGEDVDRVREATEIVKEKRPDLKIEGPIQYDAAVDPVVGKSKLPQSEVAGKASVLIFPDLNTGNNTYKAVQRETGALAIGPMLQGLNKPVNDLSRGCTVEDVFNTVILTSIQAAGL